MKRTSTVFASRNIGDRKCIGTFELRGYEEPVKIEDLEIDCICGISGYTYSDTVTNYDEPSIAFFCGKDGYLLHSIKGKKENQQMQFLHCSKSLLFRYTRQYPVGKPEHITCFYDGQELMAMRFDYGNQYLYFKTSAYCEIECQLANYLYHPNECYSLHSERGKHIEFKEREVKGY